MLLASNTDFAPWTIIVSNDKKKARLNTIKSILARIDYPKKISKKELEVDEKLVKTGSQEIAIMAKTLRNEGLKKIEDKKK